DVGRALQLGQVGGDFAFECLGDRPAGALADARKLLQTTFRVQSAELVGVHLLHEIAGASERLGFLRGRPLAVEQVHDAVERGEGLGNRFLGGIREVDAILYVLRAFDDENVVGGHDPLDDLHTLEFELTLADLASAESQIDRRRKSVKGPKAEPNAAAELAALEWAIPLLSEGTPLYRAGLNEERREGLKPFFFLTVKPVLAVVNLDEDQIGDDTVLRPVRDHLGDAAEVLGVCVQLEAEAAQLMPEERTELLEGLGLGEGVLPRVACAAHHLLGLRTFLTTGDKES